MRFIRQVFLLACILAMLFAFVHGQDDDDAGEDAPKTSVRPRPTRPAVRPSRVATKVSVSRRPTAKPTSGRLTPSGRPTVPRPSSKPTTPDKPQVRTKEVPQLQRLLRDYHEEHRDSLFNKIDDRCRHNNNCPFCYFYTACCANMQRYGLKDAKAFNTIDAYNDPEVYGSCICGKNAVYDAGGFCWGDPESPQPT